MLVYMRDGNEVLSLYAPRAQARPLQVLVVSSLGASLDTRSYGTDVADHKLTLY